MTRDLPEEPEHQEPVAAMSLWPAPFLGSRPVQASLTVPGSKSLTNRWLLLAAVADAPSRLRAPLRSRDTELMAQALRELGARVEDVPGHGDFGDDWLVTPIPFEHLRTQAAAEDAAGTATERRIECGLAGTVMRFVPALAALVPGRTEFHGDAAAERRPMGPVIEALRGLGVEVQELGEPGRLPFAVIGRGALPGGRLSIDASESSQFVSALLLVAARFEHGLQLRHVGADGAGVPSLPHVEMTLQTLREAGVRVEGSEPAAWSVSPGTVQAVDLSIEQDLSNAGPFLAAAVVSGGTVSIPRWPLRTTQGGAHWQQILPAFGAQVSLEPEADGQHGTFTVSASKPPHGVDLDLSQAGELAPTVAAICAVADSPSVLRGIAHLRGHETDRLAALVTEIRRIGGRAEETADGLRIEPGQLHPAVMRSYEDHRMATAAAVIGLVLDGVQVEDIATTAKTLPQFPQLWNQMVTGSVLDTGAVPVQPGSSPVPQRSDSHGAR